MTRYKVYFKPSLSKLMTPKEDYSDLQSRMARLVGLEDSDFTEQDSVALKKLPFLAPQELTTEQPLSSNPFAKVGVVGAATFAFVVFVGVFLTQIISGNHRSLKNRVATPKIQSSLNSEPRFMQQAKEIEALKTKLALGEQAKDIIAAQQQLRSQKPTLAVRSQKPISVRNKPVAVRTVYLPPRVVTIERQLPQPEVKSTPQLPITTNVPPLPVAPPAPDPLDKWSMLAKLGSYGQLPSTSKPSASYNVATNNAPIVVQRPAIQLTDNPSPPTSVVTHGRQSAVISNNLESI